MAGEADEELKKVQWSDDEAAGEESEEFKPAMEVRK